MSLALERERAVQALCAHFAQDHLTTQELELRFEEVYRASSLDQLRRLMSGLPALAPTAATTPLPTYSVAAVSRAPAEKRFLALMGEVNRQGRWSVPAYLKVSAIMGTVRLDLRKAEVPATGVDTDATAVMGAVRMETRLPKEGALQAWKRRRLNG